MLAIGISEGCTGGETSEAEAASRANAPDGSGLALALDRAQPHYRSGGPLDVAWRLTNTGDRPALVISHFETTAGRHYDPLRLTVANTADGSVRQVSFVRPRQAAAKIDYLLGPGWTLANYIDLAEWLGGGLEAATYELGASYEMPPDARPPTELRSVDSVGRCDDLPSSAADGAQQAVWTGSIASPPLRIEVTPR